MSQTIFFLSLSNALAKAKLVQFTQKLKCFTTLILLTFFITSCSTQAPKNSLNKSTDKAQIIQPNIKVTANTLLSQSKRLYIAGNTKEAIAKLVNASELFLLQGQSTKNDYEKALWLADKVLTVILNTQEMNRETTTVGDAENYSQSQLKKQPLNHLENKAISNLETIHTLMVIRAQSLLALGHTKTSAQQLKAIKTYAEEHNLPLNRRYYLTQSKVWFEQDRPVESIHSDLYAFALSKNLTAKQLSDETTAIWHKLIVLTPWQIDLLSQKVLPFSKGWLALTNIANRLGQQNTQLQQALTQWQQKFPTHPANLIAQQLLSTKLQSPKFQNLAILLPLSGRNKPAGLAAQQGILAAYQSNTDISLQFLDTNTLDWTTLTQKLETSAIDFVIGPLLKENLNRYLLLKPSVGTNNSIENNASEDKDDPQKNISAITIPTLLLNIPQNSALNATTFALSMLPEEEGTQAAASLSHKKYKKPIILSHNDAVSKRIAQAFVAQWYLMTEKTIDVIYFDSGKIMQENIKESLDVNQSESRIKELTSKLQYTLKTQTRNRRDLDMIYLIGSAKQTRLVKPYIEVNISPFAKNIPIYGSSRSHSIRNDSSSNSDLQGLTFTQVPWLLNSNQQNRQLAQISKGLWPSRTDQSARIFALGYDSLQLINTLPLMLNKPYIRHYGQTGILQLGTDRILHRTLLWGQYKQGKVIEVEIN